MFMAKGDQDSRRMVGQYPKMERMPELVVAAIAALTGYQMLFLIRASRKG